MSKVIQFKKIQISKAELAEQLYPNQTIDYAIPQQFIDIVNNKFTDDQLKKIGNVASHFVYLYPDVGVERIAPLTDVGIEIQSILATYI